MLSRNFRAEINRSNEMTGLRSKDIGALDPISRSTKLMIWVACAIPVLLIIGCECTRSVRDVSKQESAEMMHVVSEAEIQDRVMGAWLGQMIGVTWGFPTEFYARYIWQMFPKLHSIDGVPANIYSAYEGGPIPLAELPAWSPAMINGAYTQDDLYVEVPFMEALKEHGVTAGWDVLGDAFAASEFPLYHANLVGRDNLRKGIRPPDSGHYRHNGHADDIDWQIEADFVGLMTPGLPGAASDIAFRTGHIMNYGDGVLGGVFVATLISRAFTADSVEAIVRAGIDAVPVGTTYRQVLDQVWMDWKAGRDYTTTLARLYERWGTADRCTEWAGDSDPLNIDAKLNGAFILLGLLYGDGDMAASMRYAMAAGQDSDCNPANVGSVLGAFYGRSGLLRDRVDWLSALDRTQHFQTTAYTLDELVAMNIELAREVVQICGGRAEAGGDWSIPLECHVPVVIAEQWPAKPNEAPTLEVDVDIAGFDVSVRASAKDHDGIAGYHCHFGDLTHAAGAKLRHTYRRPGDYELIVYVIDRTGNSTYQVEKVQVRSESDEM
jgi:hypothetical protein